MRNVAFFGQAAAMRESSAGKPGELGCELGCGEAMMTAAGEALLGAAVLYDAVCRTTEHWSHAHRITAASSEALIDHSQGMSPRSEY